MDGWGNTDSDYECADEDYYDNLDRMLAEEEEIIRTIERSKKNLPYDSVAIITKAIKNPGITSLTLKNQGIGNEGAKLIAKILEHTYIIRLELGGNEIGTEGAKAIMTALTYSRRITHLDLGETKIDDRGVKFIAEELKNTRLTSLVLGRTNIGDEGAEAIANVLKDSQIISMDLKGDAITDKGKLSILLAVVDTQIIEMKIDEDAIGSFISNICKNNLTKMNKIYEDFQRFVSKNYISILDFVADKENSKPTRYIDFTKTILLKKQSYIDYFVSVSNKTFTRDQIEDFIENIEKRLTEFFSKLSYSCIEHTKLLLLCEREGLSLVVEGLLHHRENYVLSDNLLHPAACILMNKYGKPWALIKNLKPTMAELLKIWNNLNLEDSLMEDQLTDCTCHDFTRKAFVKFLSRNQ